MNPSGSCQANKHYACKQPRHVWEIVGSAQTRCYGPMRKASKRFFPFFHGQIQHTPNGRLAEVPGEIVLWPSRSSDRLWAKKGLTLGQGADERLPWPLCRDWPRPIPWPEQMRMQAKRGAQRKLLVCSSFRPCGWGPQPAKSSRWGQSLKSPWMVPGKSLGTLMARTSSVARYKG